MKHIKFLLKSCLLLVVLLFYFGDASSDEDYVWVGKKSWLPTFISGAIYAGMRPWKGNEEQFFVDIWTKLTQREKRLTQEQMDCVFNDMDYGLGFVNFESVCVEKDVSLRWWRCVWHRMPDGELRAVISREKTKSELENWETLRNWPDTRKRREKVTSR